MSLRPASGRCSSATGLRACLGLLLAVTFGCGGALESTPPAPPAPPDAGNVAWFEDVAETTGLRFRHFNGMSGRLYMAEMMGPGTALLDYDNDGDLDVLLLQGEPLGLAPGEAPPSGEPEGGWRHRLFRNDLHVGPDGEPRLSFTDVTEALGLDVRGCAMGVSTGDFDRDGWVDLYITQFGPNVLLRNRRGRGFDVVTDAAGVQDDRWSVPAVFFDADRDGNLDLYVGNYVDFRLTNHKECLSPAGYADYCGPQAYQPESDRLFQNLGGGRFRDVTVASGLASAFGPALGAVSADFDASRWADLYVANDGAANQLWMNRGDGRFEDRALLAGCALNAEGMPEASMGVDAGDYDNDGDEDLFMTHLMGETNTLYRNDGDGFFEDVTAAAGLGAPSWTATGFGTAWVDFDNDGWLDLLAVNGAVTFIEAQLRAGDPFPLHQPNQLFRNRRDGTFEDVTELAGPEFRRSEVSRGAAFGDVDNDGDTDVLIANNHGPARLLLNHVGNRRGWIGLRLRDRSGRVDALGAWVRVRTTAGDRWRRVRTTASYASAGDPRLLVGLGDAEVLGVDVQWPDGTDESWPALEPGRYHELVQGTAP